MIGRLVLAVALGPFLWLAGRDLVLHLRTRKPPRVEDLLHLGLGVAQALLVTAAFRADLAGEIVGLVLVAALGLLDEFVFHRDLPPVEVDVHAKSHMALFAFVAVALAVNHLDVAALVRRFGGGAS